MSYPPTQVAKIKKQPPKRQGIITINVPLILKMREITFFADKLLYMGHFEITFEHPSLEFELRKNDTKTNVLI